MSSLVETAVRDSVLTITLCDEERRNALSSQLVKELMAACADADADSSIRVVTVTNRGSTFCAGANLAAQSSERSGGDRLPSWELFSRISRSPKPYVGRIAGHAVAGGVGLAAVMDISIAVEEAKFGFTEVRVGVAPAVISAVCLPKLRAADARAAFLRGNRFSAPEAAAMGLINAAVPKEGLDDEVGLVVADLLAGAPGALAASKRLLRSGGAEEEDFLRLASLSAELFAGEEAQEGMAAFREKRLASWVPDPRGNEG
jgi:methylglutaconyl-CoA hydratase